MSLHRRSMLRLLALAGVAAAGPGWSTTPTGRRRAGSHAADRDASRYGRWVVRERLPAFRYDADQDALDAALWDPIVGPPTRRHWVMLGNRAIQMQVANDGTVALFDERHGLRWLTAPDPAGTGVSVVVEDDGATWGSDFATRAGERTPRRTFGPTWCSVRDRRDGLTLERTMLCPEGEVPWLLVRVRLALSHRARGHRAVRHLERWALRPRFLGLLATTDQLRERAELAVSFDVSATGSGVAAEERFASPDDPAPVGPAAASLVGPPQTLVLDALGKTGGEARWTTSDSPHPDLEIETALTLAPGARRDLWFRFGVADGTAVANPREVFERSLRDLRRRLPRARARRVPAASREIPWHAALLTGGASVDAVIGGHTLDQASAYSFVVGFDGAARDPLQHALPLVYVEPALALSALRNTCAWATPEGDLPYALLANKAPSNLLFRPSDQNLWALWLAAEYAAATGDLAAFDAPLAYHPARTAAAVPLREHLRRQFRFFVDVVGRGEGGHVRILNADWNDLAVRDSGVDRERMIAEGSSVLNSAMAAWVLPVFAGLADRLGETALAAEARAQADELRALVATAWNGRWFHRAYAPGGVPVGDADCWLEGQPWAILCGAATDAQATALLDTIDQGHRAGSPLGARLRWPAPLDQVAAGTWGEGTLGGVWYAILMTVVWAAAKAGHALAWDEWRRMGLAAHTEAYPDVWEGTLSGPDAWNAPEAPRAGRTWRGSPPVSMQAFPVNNLHSHAQPLLAYLRLLGVEPTPSGTLAVGGGADFHSPTLVVRASGHGRLRALGPVTVDARRHSRSGGPGEVRW